MADLQIKTAAPDRAAFRDPYCISASKLMDVLLRSRNNRAPSKDALQEVTRVCLKAARVDASNGPGMTWLIALSRNLAINRLCARPDHVSHDQAMSDPAPRTETRLIAAGKARRLNDCFACLKTRTGLSIS